jgi:hypothetical protein
VDTSWGLDPGRAQVRAILSGVAILITYPYRRGGSSATSILILEKQRKFPCLQIHTDFVKYRLSGSSAWRQRLAQKFPDDPRNLLAAKALGKLARDENVSTETMAALAPYADTPRRFMGLAPRSDLDRIDRFVIRPLNEIHNAFPVH